MKVTFISKTQPSSTVPIDSCSTEQLMIYCARVSSKNQDNPDHEGLLRYCINNGHWSVFEMADMTVEIETSRAVAAQLLRHRSFSFQELSQRYAEVHSHEPVELRMQGDSKQGSAAVTNMFNQSVDFIIDEASKMYEYLISMGVSRETARMVLPMCTTTKLYMKGSVRSWIHYLQVRLDKHTQKEHREIAEKIFEIFKEHFPVTTKAVTWE